MQSLPDWSPKSNDVYIPLRQKFSSMLAEVHGKIYDQMIDFDDWVNRTIKVKPVAEEDHSTWVWDPATEDFVKDGPDAYYVTWRDFWGLAFGPTTETAVDFNPVLAWREWFGGKKAANKPSTMRKCTFEYGYRATNCDDHSFGGTAWMEPGPYKCFQPLAQFSRVARTRKGSETYGPFEAPDVTDKNAIAIFTKTTNHWSFGASGYFRYDKPYSFQDKLWDAERVRDYLDEVFGLNIATSGRSDSMFEVDPGEFERYADFDGAAGLDYGSNVELTYDPIKNKFEQDISKEGYEHSYLRAMCKTIQRAIKGVFGLKGSLGRVNGGMLLEAAESESAWNTLRAQVQDAIEGENIYADNGNVNTDLILEYARQLVDDLKLSMLREMRSWFDYEYDRPGGIGSLERYGYLTWRWCPSEVEGWSHWHNAYNVQNMARPEYTRPTVLNTPFTEGDIYPFTGTNLPASAFKGKISYATDGPGSVVNLFSLYNYQTSADFPSGGQTMPRNADLGNYEKRINTALKDILSDFWDNNFERSLKLGIRDSIELLALYWGISYDVGEWRKLANVNIVVQKNGWFFFDMQKYMYQNSAISHYLDPARLESYLPYGKDMLNYYIRLTSAELESSGKIQVTDDTIPQMLLDSEEHKISTVQMKAKYVEGLEFGLQQLPPFVGQNSFEAINPLGGYMVPKAKISAIDAAGWEDFRATTGGEIKVGGELANKIGINAYLMLRNYDFPFETISNDYRLMSFNYNYFLDDDEVIMPMSEMRYADNHKATINVTDRSLRILIGFYNTLQTTRDSIEGYYEEAQSNCAYNTFDSEFNFFFKEQMIARYEEDLKTAPWIRGPIVYAMFRDLFENAFGGDYYATSEEARKLMDSINPETGWLSALEEFMGLFSSLVSAFEDHIRPVIELSESGPMESILSFMTYEVDLGTRTVDTVDYVDATTGEFPDLDVE